MGYRWHNPEQMQIIDTTTGVVYDWPMTTETPEGREFIARVEAAGIGPFVLVRDLETERQNKIDAIDNRTMSLITDGFDYDIAGTRYHFGYDKTDQENFTAATLAAALSMMLSQPFVQSWRGWVGDVPHEITLDALGMVAIATYAGKTHKQGLLASGWALTNAARAAVTLEELDAIIDERQ